MNRIIILIIFVMSLSACVSTQVMPLAPNVVRIDTTARGLLGQGKAAPETMTKAAQETLARGYTHFKLSDASMGQGSEVVGASGWSSGNAYRYGNSANFNSFGNATVNRRHVEGVAATVTMFHAGEPGAQGAFDAKQLLAQYQGAR